MIDFEQLQSSWQQQAIPATANIENIKTEVKAKWDKQQRKQVRSNILMTLGFAAALSVFAWVFINDRAGHTVFFSGSILFMTVLLLVYLCVAWKGLTYKKIDFASPGNLYIDYYIGKLSWQRSVITHYTVIYTVLLWLALMFYTWDVTQKGTFLFRTLAFLIPTVYISGISLIMKKKRKKQIREIDGLIDGLRKLKN